MTTQIDHKLLNKPDSSQGLMDIVSDELLAALYQSLEENNHKQVKKLVSSLDPADLSLLLEKLDSDQRLALVDIIKDDFDPVVLSELPEDIRDDIIQHIGIAHLAAMLPELDSDDAFLLIETLDPHQRKEVLSYIPAEKRATFEKIMTFPEDSAARLMQQEFVTVPSFWIVESVLEFLRNTKDLPEVFYEIYVVNTRHKPVGIISLDKLLKSGPETKIDNIMEKDFKSVSATTDQEEVAHLFRHYNLISTPVVDQGGRIIGMITADDVVDVIDEEAEKDIMQLTGVSNTDLNAPFLVASTRRMVWLVVTFVNALLVTLVVDHFKTVMEQHILVAVLAPIVAAMGGTSGTQVVAITVRALATRILKPKNMWQIIYREGLMGCLNGVLFSFILIGIVMFWFNNLQMALILTGALTFNMIWAAVSGVFLPITVEKFGLDPAVSAGPLVAATTDILGFAAFLGLASLFLL